MDSKIRILLADDHKMIRDGVRGLLQQEPDFEVVAEAADGQAAVELTDRTHPDVVVMDVSMPRLNGVEATAQIKRRDPHVSVIGLSMHESKQVERAMRQAGSSAFVRKDEAADVLIGTIRRACGGDGRFQRHAYGA